MSKTAKLSDQHVSEIAQQVGSHLKQAGHGASSAPAGSGSKGAFFWGAASGIAVMLAAPLLRPAALTAIKAGIQDITAEARAALDRDNPTEDGSSVS